MSTAPPTRQLSPSKLLGQVTAVIALAVAVLYVVGALTKVSEIAKAGFDPGVVVPPVPIQQLLGLGVSTVANPSLLLWAVIAALIVGIQHSMNNRTFKAAQEYRAQPRAESAAEGAGGKIDAFLFGPFYRGIPFPSLLTLVISVIAFLSISDPWSIVVLCIGVTALFRLSRRGRMTSRLQLLIIGAMTVAVVAVRGIAYPLPLPEAVASTRNGAVVGQLLASTDSSTMIGLGSCRIEVIPATEIQSITIVKRPHTPPRSLVNLIFKSAPREHAPIAIAGKCGVP